MNLVCEELLESRSVLRSVLDGDPQNLLEVERRGMNRIKDD